jgi:hypothetical protein
MGEQVKKEDEMKDDRSRYDLSPYSMFRPTSARQLSINYPELFRVEEFDDMQANDIIFAWYYGHCSSPFFDVENERERAKNSYRHAYELIDVFGKAPNKDQYVNGRFPEKMNLAIARMERFSMTSRIRVLRMLERSLDNVEKILNIDASNDAHFKNKDGEVDFSKKKAYIDTVAKANDFLPLLIDRVETEGFSVKKDKKSDEDKDFSFADKYHENNM